MSWILLVIIAHFLSAGIAIIDKYLLKRKFSHPINYTFWIGILSVVILVLAPFGFSIPPAKQMVLSLVAGIIWLIGAGIFYNALYEGETSRVVPTMGGLIPVFILILSFIFLGERLSLKQLIAFCLLVGGGIILSLLFEKEGESFNKKIRMIKAFVPAVISALMFAVYYVVTKIVFIDLGFINGLIWLRLGSALGALFLIIPSSYRKKIFEKAEITKKSTLGFFVSARGLGIVAGLLIYWAIFLGSVTLVNALQGVQYAFILLLAFLFFRKIPSLKEHLDKRTLIQKIIAIIIIGIGLVILVL